MTQTTRGRSHLPTFDTQSMGTDNNYIVQYDNNPFYTNAESVKTNRYTSKISKPVQTNCGLSLMDQTSSGHHVDVRFTFKTRVLVNMKSGWIIVQAFQDWNVLNVDIEKIIQSSF